jgi:hypothetical protein
MAVLRTDLPPGQRIPRNLPGVTDANLGPLTPSPDYFEMAPYWDMVGTLVKGQDAVKEAGQAFLPAHPGEDPNDYNYRLDCGVLTNIYADTVETLASKPFKEELRIVDGSASVDFIGTLVKEKDPDTGELKDTGRRKGGLVENIDGKGNHLHVFANWVFYNGINAAIDWIFVDYPKAPTNLTAGEESKYNIRPYWYRIGAQQVLEVESAMIGGIEEIVYFRNKEYKKVRNAGTFNTEWVERVREITRAKLSAENEPNVYGPPTWIVWERDPKIPADPQNPMAQWKVVDLGTYSIGVIPVVPFICGKRQGCSWVIDPPMKSAATLQVELYQMETGLKHARLMSCYPMLVGTGVNLKDEKGQINPVVIGPNTVLSTPASPDGRAPGQWSFIEPSAESLKFVSNGVDAMKADLRELGRQPLTAASSNLTVITAAFAADKANSAVQAWAIGLKDCLETALMLTAKWLKTNEEPEVFIDLDWLVELDDSAGATLLQMRQAGDLSQATLWSECKRHGILSGDFDSEGEKKKLLAEVPSEGELNAAVDGLNGNQPPPSKQPKPPRPNPGRTVQ